MPPDTLSGAAASRRGVAAVTTSFILWGVYPLYFKPLASVSPLQIIGHRVVWCAVCVIGWLALQRSLGVVAAVFRDRRTVGWLLLSAALISLNWLVYVWAVTHGRVVEASLGYFINPLLNVVIGVLLLGERLNRAQWAAVALAAAGVGYLTYAAGGVPWVSLVLAGSFGGYGLVRKLVRVGALAGLAVETALLTPLALAWLLWCAWTGTGALGSGAAHVDLLLVGSGIVTAIPLALFASGTRAIPYNLTGVLQFVAPTLQFAIGVLVFGELFTPDRAIGFGIIWAGVAVYLADGFRASRR
jgi:chloramphenicol-sensitive protein RarD